MAITPTAIGVWLALSALGTAVLNARAVRWMKVHRADRGFTRETTFWAHRAVKAAALSALVTEVAFSPWPHVGVANVFGAILAAAMIGLNRRAKRELGVHYSPATASDDPDQVRIQTGPYRYLRHPIYIGNTVLIAGLYLAGGVRWAWAVMPVYVAVIAWRIAREERFLREKLG